MNKRNPFMEEPKNIGVVGMGHIVNPEQAMKNMIILDEVDKEMTAKIIKGANPQELLAHTGDKVLQPFIDELGMMKIEVEVPVFAAAYISEIFHDLGRKLHKRAMVALFAGDEEMTHSQTIGLAVAMKLEFVFKEATDRANEMIRRREEQKDAKDNNQ